MTLPDKLAQRIEALAEREGLTPETLLETLLDEYEAHQRQEGSIEDFIGAFDDDVTDLSVTVRETLHQKFVADDDRSA